MLASKQASIHLINLHLAHDPPSLVVPSQPLVVAMNLVRALVARSLHDHSTLPFLHLQVDKISPVFTPPSPSLGCHGVAMFALENRDSCRPLLINDVRTHSDQIDGV